MTHNIPLKGQTMTIKDSDDLFYKKRLIFLIEHPGYDLPPHEQTISGMIKLLIENGGHTLGVIRGKEFLSSEEYQRIKEYNQS